MAADFDERAAILEFDNAMSRAEAERLAISDILDRRSAELPNGILGELIAAVRRRLQPEIEAALAAAGLRDPKAPAWGVGHIVAERQIYRPAAAGEPGQAAILVPSTADGAIEDLVAQDIATSCLHTRFGVAAIVGADEVEWAKLVGEPLLVFGTLAAWLRCATRGVVVVDWRRAGAALDGVEAILAPAPMAKRLHDATSRCWPRPVIAIPRRLSHAA